MFFFLQHGCILKIYWDGRLYLILELNKYILAIFLTSNQSKFCLFRRGKGWCVSLRCVVRWRRSTRRFCPSTNHHWVKKSWIRREPMPWSHRLRNSLRFIKIILHIIPQSTVNLFSYQIHHHSDMECLFFTIQLIPDRKKSLFSQWISCFTQRYVVLGKKNRIFHAVSLL